MRDGRPSAHWMALRASRFALGVCTALSALPFISCAHSISIAQKTNNK